MKKYLYCALSIGGYFLAVLVIGILVQLSEKARANELQGCCLTAPAEVSCSRTCAEITENVLHTNSTAPDHIPNILHYFNESEQEQIKALLKLR